MAKIKIKMLQDFSDGSTIKHKPCAELLFDFEANEPTKENKGNNKG